MDPFHFHSLPLTSFYLFYTFGSKSGIVRARRRVRPFAGFEAMVRVQQGTVPGTVVQGTVVQGTVVGQPVAWQDRWGYPVGQSQPPMQQDMSARPEDIQGAQSGWLLYSIGWVLCCCCGPVGPIFWLAVAGRHFCKPAEERKQLPNESQVANVSLITAAVTVLLNVLLMTMLMGMMPSNSGAVTSSRIR